MKAELRSPRQPPATLSRVFAVPAALLLASIGGLIAGLAGDGWADAIAWSLLAIPILAAIAAFARRG